jgi:hypothetical protein
MESAQLDVLTIDGNAELLKIPYSSGCMLTQQGKSPSRKWAGIGAFTVRNW